MMSNLSTIYDAQFFKEWGVRNESYTNMARFITDLLYDQFRPKRLIDLGCGCGVYGYYFSKKNVDVVSIDGVQPPKDESFPVSIIQKDLTVAFENEWGNFDASLCLEVAEHIPEKWVDSFLQNLTRFSDTLILSAAPPNQGGHHHVNEQPKRYWVKKLADKGFLYNRKETGKFLEKFKGAKAPLMWMGEQISIYQRMKDDQTTRPELPFQV